MLRLVLRIVALVYIILLTIELSSHPLAIRSLDLESDNRFLTALLKLGHFWAMTLLGLFVTAARPTHSKAFIVLFLLTYAVAMEMLHRFLPTRSFEWVDLFQNVTGVIAGVIACETIGVLFNRFRNASPRDAV